MDPQLQWLLYQRPTSCVCVIDLCMVIYHLQFEACVPNPHTMLSEPEFPGPDKECSGCFKVCGATSSAAQTMSDNLLSKIHADPFYWKHLPRPTNYNDLPSDPKERAQKLFNLVDPVDSLEWEDYIKVRDRGEWISTEYMCKEADEPDTYYQNLHPLAWKCISRALPDDHELARRIADSIDVLSCWTRDEGDPVVQLSSICTVSCLFY